MSLKILHLPLILFLIMSISFVVSGENSKPNLIIPGVFQTPESNEINEEYAKALGAEYIPAYSSDSHVWDVDSVDSATPNIAATAIDPITGDVIPVEEVRAIDAEHGKVERNIIDPSTGAIISYARYFVDDINGLKDERLDGKQYDTIYAYSGGARTAVTALLYQGVTADRLVLISPASGLQGDEDYYEEIQRLLDSGIVKEITVYQSDLDAPDAGKLWQGKFENGDITGNFEILPVDEKLLDGKTGNDRHAQMWDAALSEENDDIKALVLEKRKYNPIPKSLLKKEFLASLKTPLLSSPAWDMSFEGAGVSSGTRSSSSGVVGNWKVFVDMPDYPTPGESFTIYFTVVFNIDGTTYRPEQHYSDSGVFWDVSELTGTWIQTGDSISWNYGSSEFTGATTNDMSGMTSDGHSWHAEKIGGGEYATGVGLLLEEGIDGDGSW